jgi:hypothetical protein
MRGHLHRDRTALPSRSSWLKNGTVVPSRSVQPEPYFEISYGLMLRDGKNRVQNA